MPDKNTPYSAPWMPNLRHRSDPNRVDGSANRPAPAVGGQFAMASTAIETSHPHPAPAAESSREVSYYDVSPLKPPVWKWQIANYFFFGGLSAGAYLIARTADRAGGERRRAVTRAGTWLAVATLLPCPALRISDLGDRKRFHHMLRIFKPASPMNLGTWMLTGYSGAVAVSALRELLRDNALAPEKAPPPAGKAATIWLQLHDLAGLPLAITVAGYTGVLLTCTSNPLWCKNPWLGALFSASAVSTGAEAISLTLDCTQREEKRRPDEPSSSQRILQTIDTVAHATEAVCMAGFQQFAAEKGSSLRSGSAGTAHRIAVGSLVAAEVLKRLPVRRRLRKPVRMLAAAAGLAGGFALRWAMVYGGKQAAADPHTARLVSRQKAAGTKPPVAGERGTAQLRS